MNTTTEQTKKIKTAREIIEEGLTDVTPTSETVEQKTESKTDAKVPAIVVKYGENGLPTFENQNELSRVASLYMQTKLAPDHLIKEGVGAVASAITFCRQMEVPDSFMANLCYIKGRLAVYGSGVTALAERHPEYGERREFFITADGDEICTKNKNIKTGKPYAAVIQIKKKNSTVWNEYTFSIDDAIKAGLLNEKEVSTKQNWQDATWTKYVKDMMYNKANRRALDANYAGALKGVIYYEDMKEVLERDVTPKSQADELNGLVD
jgi:hypothetical protein